MNHFYYSKDGVTVSVILDTRREKKDGFPVKVRVNYGRRNSYFPTGKTISKSHWEQLLSSRKLEIVYLRKDIENSFELVKKAVEDLTSAGSFTLSRLNARLKSNSSAKVLEAIRSKIGDLKSTGRIGNAYMYHRLVRNIDRFAGSHIVFEDITPTWLRRYEAFLRSDGKRQTTIAIEMRTLRAVFNEAIRNLVVREAIYPFGRGKYEIQEGSGRKMALTLEDIGKIARYETQFAAKRKYRDYWMFLYLCNGINVVDFCQLKYSDILDGEIHFVRQKTRRTAKQQQEIRVVLSEDAKRIIQKHGNLSTDGYIFPILNGNESPEQMKLKTQYTTRAINKHMAEISAELGIPHTSTYTARHSFATVLKRAGVSIAYISESLGHSNLQTTEHYLASFEREEREKNALLLTQF